MGSSSDRPGDSCKQIINEGFSIGDGIYWIDPNGGNTTDSFQVYCDMTVDGGGWILTYKLKNDAGDSSPNYFIYVDDGSGADFPLDLSGGFVGSGWVQGASAEQRWNLWLAIEAEEYRATTYEGETRLFDVKKSDYLDNMNMFYCAASGYSNSLTNGHHNETFGQVVSLMTITQKGINFVEGSSYSVYQFGGYGCNCWESLHAGGNYTNGPMIFGDNDHSGMYLGGYTLFWIR